MARRPATTYGIWICFFAFWALNIFVILRGIETIKFLEGIAAPFMLAIGLLLLWWITSLAGGLGPVLRAPSKFATTGAFLKFFIPSLTGMVGFWATVALNIPDFTRYAKSQRDQALGQALGLPAAMTLYSFIGVAVTSAWAVIFGEPIWDPVVLLGRFNRPVVATVALVALLIATLNTNVAANVVSPSNDFSNLNPRRISFRTGGIITGVIGVLLMPWKLLGDFSAYIFGWLVGYSGLLGPIAGIMIADYFLVLRKSAFERRRPVSPSRRIRVFGWRQLASGNRAGDRDRRGVVRARLFATAMVVRLRVVRGLFCGRRIVFNVDEKGVQQMIATETSVRPLKFFVNGKWEDASATAAHPVTNPATGEVIARVPYATECEVDRAVTLAHEAFLKWREVPVVDRVQVLYRYKTLLEKNLEDVARILSTENGKTFDDAKIEVRRGIQMVEFACGMPTLMMGDSLENVSRGIDSKTIRQPLGVCAGITPFNFPAMVPMWMFPFAIACGNTFILKPSEKVPLTPTRTAELLEQAGVPAGVYNVIHGDKIAVDALIANPLIRAISFVGSSPVAKHVYETSAKHGKRVQALGGAKNHLVVMPDADMDKSVEAIMSSAFGAAGERCLAGSVLVPVGDVAEPLLDLLVSKAKALHVGDGMKDGIEMGPLVTGEHRDKVAGHIEKGVAEGAEPLCDGRRDGWQERGRLLSRTHDFRFRDAADDHRERGDLRARAFRDSGKHAGRSDRSGEQFRIRQYDLDFHWRWEARARIRLAR